MCRHDADTATTVEPRQVLPTNVAPIHYRVRLEPDLEKFTFTGEVEIDLDVKEASKSVTVNALDLKLGEASLAVDGKQTETATAAIEDADAQAVRFEFANEVPAGAKATLRVPFEGELNDKLVGFYRSVHTDDTGKTRVVATTQMEATDCRRAFPCFDEPALKATFDITLVAPKDLVALSNMDVRSEEDAGNGKKAVAFNTTPKMSTYLVAFIVGDLSYVESNYFRIPVRVYATPGMEDKCKFSAELGARTLEFFEKKFDVKYPLPKMDMVGIHDFSAGAMENWGLVTYRVVDLLFDEANDSADTKQRVAEVVQHELAHQWFGNLVTMEWWDGLWLNEGFATWMSWYSCNAFYPEWKVWETYVGDNLQGCLSLDGLRSSHPVQVPVARADQIHQIFDAISYSKGSCIVKMAANLLGEETFIKGISHYLKTHAYGNTQTSDLWKALSDVSGVDVPAVMDTWTSKIGYPIVTVVAEDLEGAGTITVRQNRYLTTGDVKPDEDTILYPLSLRIRTKSGVQEVTMTEREKTIKLDDAASGFYKLNADQTGVYRVKYPEERVSKLSQAGTEGLLSVEDRVGLVADIGSTAVSGYVPTSSLLELVSQWKNEDAPNVWKEVLTRLASLRATWLFEGDDVQAALRAFSASLVLPKAKQVGWTIAETDSLLDQMLKGDLFNAACTLDDDAFVADALDMFKRFAAGDAKAIDPNLRRAVFKTAGKYGDESTWNRLLDVYRAPSSGQDGNTALASLGRSKNVDLRRKTLAAALDGTVRSQDVFYAISGFGEDPEGAEMVWKWLVDNWDKLLEKFPPSLGMFGHIITLSTRGFTTQKQLDDISAFFADKDTKGFDKSIEIVKDRLKSRISWLERDRAAVEQWLRANKFLQ